jgi:hypothetical protein
MSVTLVFTNPTFYIRCAFISFFLMLQYTGEITEIALNLETDSCNIYAVSFLRSKDRICLDQLRV